MDLTSKLGILKRRKLIWYGISAAIIAVLIYLADVGKVLNSLKSVDPLYMSIATISGLSVFLIWGYIWHSFFDKLEIETDLIKSYKLFMAGNFMNSITPLGQLGGEPFMAYVVSKNTDASYETSLSSVMSSDIINTIPFVLYASSGLLYLFFFGTANARIKEAVYLIFAIMAVLGALAYLLWFDRNTVQKVIFNILDFLEAKFNLSKDLMDKIREKTASLKSKFEQVGRDPNHIAKTVFIAHLAPITQFICLYSILIGLGWTPEFLGVYLTVILASLAMFSPTPGGSGTFEAAFTGLLLFFFPGIGPETAVAAAVLFRLTTYWPGIAIGYYTMIDLRRK